MPETSDIPEQTPRAVRQAEERGRRQQLVDGRLDSHEARLNAINGNIERSARAQEVTNHEIQGTNDALHQLSAKIEQNEAVANALGKASVSRREFWLAVAAVIAILLGAIITSGLHA